MRQGPAQASPAVTRGRRTVASPWRRAGVAALALAVAGCGLETAGLARTRDGSVGPDAGHDADTQDAGTDDAGPTDAGATDAGAGDAGAPMRLSLDDATLARANAASLFDEATGTMTWFGANERRYRMRAGQREILLEGSTTNYLVTSEAGWSGLATFTDNVAAGPDATMSADRATLAGSIGVGTGGHVYEAVSPPGPPAGPWAQSLFVRLVAGGPMLRHRPSGPGGTAYPAVAFAVGAAWSRAAFSSSTLGAIGYFGVGTYHDFAPDPELPAITVDLWGAMIEARPFPSSYVRSVGVPGMREADVLTFASLPTWMLVSGPWRVTVTPEWASAELVAPAYLIDRAGLDYVRMVPSAGMTRIEVATGGLPAVSHEFSVTARDTTLTFTFDPRAGTLGVAGAAAGDGTTMGTPWAWENGAFRVGADLFGWLGEPATP